MKARAICIAALTSASCGPYLTRLSVGADQLQAEHERRRSAIVMFRGVAYAVPNECFEELSTSAPQVYGAQQHVETPAISGASSVPEVPAISGASSAPGTPAVLSASSAPPSPSLQSASGSSSGSSSSSSTSSSSSSDSGPTCSALDAPSYGFSIPDAAGAPMSVWIGGKFYPQVKDGTVDLTKLKAK